MAGVSTFVWVSIFAIGAMVVNSIGIWFVYKNIEWAQKYKEFFMCFAAGVLISSPLLIAFPQAVAKTPHAGIAALVGFVFMFFSNKLIKYKTSKESLAFGIIAMEGIGIHSFIDGIIYSVTFSVSTYTGLLAGIGLVVHEFAEGVITFSFMVKGGISKKRAGIYAFLVAGLTTPIGAFIAYPIVSKMNDSLLGLALGFVVGVLIYLSASHLLPEVREHERKHAYWAFISGILLGFLIYATKQ
jgi:zinc transporter ZupT